MAEEGKVIAAAFVESGVSLVVIGGILATPVGAAWIASVTGLSASTVGTAAGLATVVGAVQPYFNNMSLPDAISITDAAGQRSETESADGCTHYPYGVGGSASPR